jgi:hypothetical protein
MKIIIKMILSIATALFLSACGGDENWGVDHQGGGIPIAKCVNNSQDATQAQAISVPSGSIIKKNGLNTVLRVWHFQNAKKAVCVVSGEAFLVAGEQS